MRIAVLGCGSIGRRHLKNLRSLGVEHLVAFDPEARAREVVLQETGVPCYATLDEIWSLAPTAVLITGPSQVHVALATTAAEHGCHLFIEKPLSHKADGIAPLAEEVVKRGLTTMVACNMRFHHGPATVQRLLREQTIGQVLTGRLQTGSYLPRWRPAQDYRQSYSASPEWGGAVLDCIHEIDLALWYFGPARLLAAATLPAVSLGLQTDGLAELLLRHDDGVLSSVHLNFVQRDSRRTCQVIGASGTIYWDYDNGAVVVYGADGQVAQVHERPADWEVNHMYLAELRHFLDAVASGTPSVNPVASALPALEIALAARQQGERG